MNPFNLLFGFSGRINRGKYWLAFLLWLVLWAAVAILLFMSDFSMAVIVAAVIVIIPNIISGIAVGIKRLHDRNKSGWWLLVFYLVPLAAFFWANLLEGGLLQTVLSTAGLLFSIYALVELGCLRGTIGGSTYGPDPVAPKPAQH